MKNATIRRGFAALSLTISVVQMAHGAAYSTPQQPIVDQQAPTSVPANRTFAGESPVAIGKDNHAGTVRPSASTRKGTIQGGNDLNWLGGGGG